jgi:DNA-nicking Smr family endonuclease
MGTKEGKHNNSEGAALFRGAVSDAQPLTSRARHTPKDKPVAKARPHRKEPQLPIKQVPGNAAEPPETEPEDSMSFQRSNITRKIMRDLRRGKYPIQEEIDLHGCTRAEAKTLLEQFIMEAAQHGLSCIRVIHGKGMRSGSEGPVLKSAVNRWLRTWDPVAAFCLARPSDGGSGAVYVLLR